MVGFDGVVEVEEGVFDWDCVVVWVVWIVGWQQ